MSVVFDMCALTEKRFFWVLTLGVLMFVSRGGNSPALGAAVVWEKQE